MSSNRLTVYTDGSCMPNPGKGGWAYVVVEDDCDMVGSGGAKFTTNNVMEMTAVIEVLKDFSEYKSFLINSDSQYVINCAQEKWQRKKNVELWRVYDKYSKDKDIQWRWVKGHSGDHYNEMVDRLAKQEIR
jgi:ribonuclease HI